ncbi:MAG: type VI secretion system contractile sheath domain-containing protein [Desulfohalobiaceae bacterium]
MSNSAAYHVLVLAPFAPVAEQSANLKVIELNPEHPATGLAKFAPVIRLASQRPADFAPKSLEDFHPVSLARSLDCFSGPDPEANTTAQLAASGSAVDNILSMVEIPDSSLEDSGAQSPSQSPNRRLMQQILADRQFRDLEAAWRGLCLLPGKQDKILLSALAINRSNISATLQGLLPELADSPPDLVLLGLDLDASPADLQIMRNLAQMADQLLTTAVLGLSPRFFGISDWSEHNKLQYLPHHLQGPEYASFNSLARKDGACGLIPVAGQAPCRNTYLASQAQFYFEDPGAPELSPAFMLTAAILEKVLQTGWPSGIGQLPELRYTLPEERARELKGTGITALVAGSGSKGRVLVPQTLCVSNPFSRLCSSRLITFLLRLRQKLGAQEPEQLTANIHQELKDLFALYEQRLPENTLINAEFDSQDRLMLSLELKLGQDPLALSLYW